MKTIQTELTQLKTSNIPNNYRPRYVKEEHKESEEVIAYKKLRYGTRGYSESELSAMTPKKRKAIIYAQERANNIISEIAQDKLNSYVIKLMKKVFPDLVGEAASILIEPVFHKGFVVDNSIAPLKVTQEEIIAEFKRKGLI